MKKINLVLGSAIVVAAPLVMIISCNDNKKTVIPIGGTKLPPNGDPKLPPKDVDMNSYLKNIFSSLEKEMPLTTEKVEKIFKNNFVLYDSNRGTSLTSKTIGDKYGDITKRLVVEFNKLKQDEISKMDLDSFSALFENDDNVKYNISSSVKSVMKLSYKNYLTKGKSGTNGAEKIPKVKEEPDSITGDKATPLENEKIYTYRDSSNLKSDDKWWTINPKYKYTDAVKRGLGTTYYHNVKKSNGTYPQFSLDDWINVYDSKFNNILDDKDHRYNEASPNLYSASLSEYTDIYYNKYNVATKQGNNNNGLNTIYSGAAFWVTKSSDGKIIKTIDKNHIETIGGQKFLTSKTISNGWEHVSPASMEGLVFGGNRKDISNAKYPKMFGKAIGDLHNLRPSIQNIFNGPRSNHPFGMVLGDKTISGVDFEIGSSLNNTDLTVVEPRVNVRGDIARILFYMHDRYHVRYDKNYYKMLTLWAAMDPVTKQEKELDEKISKVMGFHNDYVTGKKKIPYDQEIEKRILDANEDKNKNSFIWKEAKVNKIENEVKTKDDAIKLNWDDAKEIEPGISPSKTDELSNGKAEGQIIVRFKVGNTLYYRKVKTLQSSAILAEEFDSSVRTIKIGIKNDALNGKIATLLSGHSRTSYKNMTDIISELKYIIVK